MQVTSEEDIKNALSLTKNKFGKLNYVINCAGIGVAYKTYNFNKNYPHQLEDFIKVLMVPMWQTTVQDNLKISLISGQYSGNF